MPTRAQSAAVHQPTRDISATDDATDETQDFMARLFGIAETAKAKAAAQEQTNTPPIMFKFNLGSPHKMSDDVHESLDGGISKKPSRNQITPNQKAMLAYYFELNHMPTSEERQSIADTVGLPMRQVQVWFQNKRQRNKDLLKEQALNNQQRVSPIQHNNSNNDLSLLNNIPLVPTHMLGGPTDNGAGVLPPLDDGEVDPFPFSDFLKDPSSAEQAVESPTTSLPTTPPSRLSPPPSTKPTSPNSPAHGLQNMPVQQPPMNLNNIRMNVGGQAVLPAHTNLLSTQLKLQQIQQNLALQIEKSLAPALAEAARNGHSLKDLLKSDNPSLEPLKKLYSLLSEHPLSLGITLPGMVEGKGGGLPMAVAAK